MPTRRLSLALHAVFASASNNECVFSLAGTRPARREHRIKHKRKQALSVPTLPRAASAEFYENIFRKKNYNYDVRENTVVGGTVPLSPLKVFPF